jgi:uncharacterized protein with HEPN domain
MREVVKDRGRLEHIITAIENVEEFTKDIDKETFVNFFFEKTNSNIVVRIAIRTFLNDNELKEFW